MRLHSATLMSIQEITLFQISILVVLTQIVANTLLVDKRAPVGLGLLKSVELLLGLVHGVQ